MITKLWNGERNKNASHFISLKPAEFWRRPGLNTKLKQIRMALIIEICLVLSVCISTHEANLGGIKQRDLPCFICLHFNTCVYLYVCCFCCVKFSWTGHCHRNWTFSHFSAVKHWISQWWGQCMNMMCAIFHQDTMTVKMTTVLWPVAYNCNRDLTTDQIRLGPTVVA